MTMSHELMDLNATNNLGVLLKGMILGHELKDPDAMNKSGLWMI